MALNPKLAKIAKNLPRVAREMGFSAKVTSGFRTRKKQQELWQLWKAGASPYPAARPGTSDHEVGLALDVVSNNEKLLVALLTEAGLYWAGESDPIHFTMIPPGAKLRYARGESRKFKMPTEKEWNALMRTGTSHPLTGKEGIYNKVLRPLLKAISLGLLDEALPKPGSEQD
jgi:hypothetical protein